MKFKESLIKVFDLNLSKLPDFHFNPVGKEYFGSDDEKKLYREVIFIEMLETYKFIPKNGKLIIEFQYEQ